MKKKIITLALVVVMCLSVITSVTAASTLNRVASTFPGTDMEYNYVEDVTVRIPGTETTFELKKVAEKVGIMYEDYFGRGEKTPVYCFNIYELDGAVIVNQDSEWTAGSQRQIEYNFASGTVIDINLHSGVTDYYANILANGELSNDVAGIATAYFDFYWWAPHKPYGEYYDEYIDISEIAVFDETDDITYSIVEGANSVVNSETNSIKIKADGEFSKFTGVKVDGDFIDSNNYTATEGSTIIEFKADYLKTLDAGEHTVSVVFTDGEATTKFEIAEDKNTENNKNENNNKPVTDVEIPNTDCNTSVVAAFVAMAFSGMALVGLKKKK